MRDHLLAPRWGFGISPKEDPPISAVGIKELKNRFTQYLRRIKQGEEVIVTERGKPIALIRPIQSAERPANLDARLARLAAQGFVTLPTRKPLRRVRLVEVAGGPISESVLEDRR